MTTPTREQVVQLSRKHWHRDEWNYEYFDAYAFYQEARADLEATIAERNKVKASYNHAEYMAERREMMQAWADWI